jgi:short-subunit dehydrogenase
MAGAGQVIVVTGASRGIGYSIGKELVTRMPGASVYLTTRQVENIQALEATLRRDIGVSSDNVKF